MFAKEWGLKRAAMEKLEQYKLPDYKTYIKKVAPLMWGEHCVECAVPECYHHCSLYQEREDGRCKLFNYGIVKRKECRGLLGYGVEVSFRKWGKLEALGNVGQYKLSCIKRLDYLLTGLAKGIRQFAALLPSSKKWVLTNIFYKCREGLVLLMGKKSEKPEALLIGIVNEHEPFKLIIEVKTLEASKFRTALEVNTGYIEHKIDFNDLRITPDQRHYLFVYPENMEEDVEVIFTALDLVTFKEMKEVQHIEKGKLKPAAKVKCVVWDLDKTLWDGILIEDGIENIKPYQKVIETIKELDQRGILNAVCSKNDRGPAKAKLEELGLWEYFVDTQINWQPKSVNIEAIARNLNIGLDTFAFIDDSPFERQEVHEALPMIRCFDETQVLDLLNESCFNVPITEDSKKRRQTYFMLAKRKEEEDKWTGNIDDFLKKCKMVLTLGKPEENEVMRCFELLQRTNQLNISGRRLSVEEVKALIDDENTDTYAMQCQDIFGDYGIVGFVVVDRHQDQPVITDLVISCRVANKKVEHSLILWLARRYQEMGFDKIETLFKPSKKNGLLARVFSDLAFKLLEENEESITYSMELSQIEKMDIVEVRERGEIEKREVERDET